MGVPKFYRWISERYPCLSQIVRQCQIPEFDNFYLDMNGIIHTCSHPNDDDPHFRISEEKIFEDILHYIEFLFRMIRPRKVFFMAVDGVAPRAKMNQQRARRFRTAKDVEAQEHKAREKGEVLPTEERFDSNCITPGTEFMARLHEQLKYFVVMKISKDKAWRDVKVYLSGHETPGEGEHKIMDFIRYERSQPGYDPNTRHCLYGLDADLIMLSLSTHEPHLAVLREEVVFAWKQPKKTRVIPEHTTFHLLHISLMREYLDFEFSALKEIVPFPYNLENIIDDWILMGFLVGNDFIPHLPYLHIQKDALQTLYKAYIEVLPTLDGYINEGGILNLERFEKYLHHLSKFDYEKFNDTYADLKYWETKTGRKMENEGGEAESNMKSDFLSCLSELEDGLDTLSLDEDEEEEEDEDELFELEFIQHKRDYYMKKLEYENVTPEVLKEQADCYVRAIQWNLHYYYNGVVSWSWFYPHHYAPYVSDVKGFNNLDLRFDKGTPFLPFQQLLSVLPEACKKLLPKPYQALMTDPDSPLKSFFPNDFKTDLNGKTQEWEAVVLLPFINEKLLVDSTLPLDLLLTADERKRNRHGPHLLYTYSEENLGTYDSSLPGHFPDIENYARCEEIDENYFRLPVEKIKKGLLENTKADVYFFGFPTFKHLKFTVELKNEEVRVFQRVSTGANMMITLEDTNTKSVEELGSSLVGETAFVHWPHLVEAQIVEVSDGEQRYYFHTSKSSKKTSVMSTPLNDVEKDIWKKEIKSIVQHHYHRFGIHTGKIKIMVRAKPLTGRRYTCTTDGKVELNKQWSVKPENFALQTLVKDVDVQLSPLKEPRTVEELYPVGTSCFVLGHPYYGAMGEIIDCNLQENKGRVRIKMYLPSEPSLTDIMRNEKSISLDNYVPGFAAARQLGISSFLFSRMMGNFLVQTTALESMVANRVNIGLNLKFNRRNEEVPGYSKRSEDGTWLYSERTIEIMENYLREFPEFFEKLATVSGADTLHVTDLFSDEEKGKETLKKITSWLKAQPFTDAQRQSCNAKILDDSIVRAIEDTIENHKKISSNFVKKYTRVQVKSNLLFCPADSYGTSPPDPNATYKLYDRVVCVQANHSVPLGYRGTVIGIEEDGQMGDEMYIVMFDNEFPGGLPLHCCGRRGYKMRSFDLINISYGQRITPHKQDVLFKEQHSIRNFPGKSYSEVTSVDQDHRTTHDEAFSQNRYEQSKQKNWNYRQKNLPPRLQFVPRNSPPKRIVLDLPQKLSKTERDQTPVFYMKSNGPHQQLNHSPHSPFILQEKEGQQENFTFGKMDMSQNFVTPKVAPVGGSPRIVSKTGSQDANSSERTLNDNGRKDFETLWKGLQQSRDTYQLQERDSTKAIPPYGKQVSVEELFQGAVNAEIGSTPLYHEEDQSQNALQVNEHESPTVKELHNVSYKLWNQPPAYKELTVGPMGHCQAEVILPNGRRFNSIISPNRQKAKETAAEEALAFLKSASHDSKQNLQHHYQPPAMTPQRFVSGPRPMLSFADGSYTYSSNFSVPPPFPTPSLKNDAFVLRHPPPPLAAFIPQSFVESNRERSSNIDSSKNFNSPVTVHHKGASDSVSQVDECSQNASGLNKEEVDLETEKELIKKEDHKSDSLITRTENMFVPMQVTKKQSAIKKSIESKSSPQKESVTHEKASHVESLQSIEETESSGKQKKRQRKSRLAVKFDGCSS